MDYKYFEFWTEEKLWELRKEIVINSLYYDDYENSFGIPKRICCDFFDGFLEYCWIIEAETENGLTDWKDIYNKYDNAEALWNYFCGVEYPFGE